MALLRKLVGKTNGQAASEAGVAGEKLLANIQQERQSLDAVLATLNGSTAALPEVRKGIDEAGERTSVLFDRLDDLSARIDNVGRATPTLDALEKRISLIEASLQKTETSAAQTLQRTEEIERQRESLETLVTLAADTVAKADSVRRDAENLGRLETQLRELLHECQQVRAQQTALTGEFETVRASATSLATDAEKTHQQSREAREAAQDAALTIAQVEQRLNALSQFEAIRQDTSEQLHTLKALAEHVASKAMALENQRHTVERAVVESQRVADMVWNMEAQIARLHEGMTLGTRVEESLTKLEQLHRDTTARLEEAGRNHSEFTTTLQQHQNQATELMQSLEGRLNRFALTLKEIETLRERQTAADSALADLESRLAGVCATDDRIKALGENIEELSRRFGEMTTRAQTLESKQSVLTTLEPRLDELEATAKRAGWQLESFSERRKDLEALKKTFEEFDSIRSSAQLHVDALRAEKQELSRFVEQMKAFMREAPQIASSVEGLKTDIADAEARAQRTADLRPVVDELACQVDLLTPRLQIIDDTQRRLGELYTSSAELDRKLTSQLARGAELDGVKIACDGLSMQLSDAQQKLAALAAIQTKLSSIPDQFSQLETALSATRSSLEAVRRDEASLTTQEHYLEALNESAEALGHDLSSRLDTLRAAQDELAKAGALKEDLRAEVAQIQALQRETFATTREADDQLQQLSARCRHLDARRSQLDLAEQTIAAIESRLADLERLSERVDAKGESIAGRERIVDAVRQEVDTIQAVARKAQEDLAAIADAHAQITQGRAEVQRLLDALDGSAVKIAEVERRSGLVDEVRRKADAVAHLLHDIRLTLDTVSEQKAVVDHVSEKLARLDEVMNEARGTTKALQSERKLAQRIVESVRSVHARAGAEIRQVG